MYARLPNWLHRLVDLLGRPFVNLIVLPSTFLYHTARYILCPYPRNLGGTHASYWTYIKNNLDRVHSGWTKGNWVNYPDADAGKILPSKYAKLCDIEKVLVPAASAPRVGVAAVGIVPSVSVPGFMLRKKKLFGEKVGYNWIAPAGADQQPSGLFERAKRGEKILYYIVGGGYAGGHPLDSHLAWSLAQITNERVFTVNYRKSLDKTTAFPASLLDTLAGYQYLLTLGFEPKNIMLCGDSAGANACLALARYLDALTDAGHHLGQVGAMCLLCPWADMTCSFPSYKRNRYTDVVHNLRTVYIPSHTRHSRPSDLYFSPALAKADDEHFARLARAKVAVYVLTYTTERFYDESVALANMLEQAGVQVTKREIVGGVHRDFLQMDREPKHQGWSWPTVAVDFQHFWLAWRNM